jgi:predicted dehydrogenase
MKSVKSVVIGCGAIAREHLTALKAIADAEVVAVCDISAAKAEAAAERFSIKKWSTDYERLLQETRPNLVHVTTPPSTHFPIAKTCLASGLHVLCEKPITVEYQDFLKLKSLAVQTGCMLLENHSIRFDSSIERIRSLINSGRFGEVLEIQIMVHVNLFGSGSPYGDENVPHFCLALRGGAIGDFLTHIACLTHLFIGPPVDLRTIWAKRTGKSLLPADEFRGLVKGELATAYVEFSGNAQPGGFWVRVVGTKMQAETNLYEPPRIAFRRFRSGQATVESFIDGLAEGRDIIKGTTAAFWRKLAGTNRYDGLPRFLSQVYQALGRQEAQPIPLDQIDAIACLVDSFAKPELML